jgi:stage II sporulation protein D
VVRNSCRYAARAGVVSAVAAVVLALGAPQGAWAAGNPPVPGLEWGVSQGRPVGPPGTDFGATGIRTERSTLGGRTSGTRLAPDSATTSGTTSSLTAAAATPGWVLHGAGWGHGIGMSQFGAYEMAKDGYTAKQILAHYYTGTTYDAVADTQVVDVNVLYHIDPASTLSASTSALATGGGAFSVVLAGATGTMTGTAGTPLTFSMTSGKIRATCSGCTGAMSLTGTQATLRWDTLAQDKTLLKIGGTQYRDGTIRITPYGTTSWNVVNRVRLHDEYLDYIAESPWSWNLEALRAQAAAARGYALAKFNRLGGKVQPSCDCHLLDTTSDQVYGGYSTVLSNGNQPYWQNWKNAVRATGSTTTGYVARYGGSIIQAFFSSSSGGRTENNEDVWGGTPLPYLRGVSDPWSLRPSNPLRAWTQTTSGSSMASAFGLSDVARLDLRDRTVNGGVHTATATSRAGTPSTITGDRMRGIAASGSAYSSSLNSTMIRHFTGRLAGSNRYASATAVASRVPVSATAVVIAGGDTTLNDASVSGPLATTIGGPLLLTQNSTLPSATIAELDRRGSAVKTAYIVGGTGVVSSTVESQLRSRGLAIIRFGGRDRYETSALVARAIRAKRSTPTVVIAGGNGLVDALGASGPASALKEPILLTQADQLTASTKSALTAIGATQSRIVGGTSVVSTTVQNQLAAMGVKPIRLAGTDRYGSSAAVAAFYRPFVPTRSEVVLTSGADGSLVDSLVAGTLQRLIVLTAPGSLVEGAAKTLQTTPALETITAVGGTGSLTAGALSAAANS